MPQSRSRAFSAGAAASSASHRRSAAPGTVTSRSRAANMAHSVFAGLAQGVRSSGCGCAQRRTRTIATAMKDGNKKKLPADIKTATRLVHPRSGGCLDGYDATAPPIYQTATFGQPAATENGEYDYTRSGNPTRTLLEDHLAALEGADRAFAFASGMAALAACTRLVSTGGHIVAGDDLYGGTSRLLSRVVPGLGISVSNVNTCDVEELRKAIIPGKTQLVMLESPTNPRMQICDIEACARVAKEAGCVVVVDNSIMAPTFCRPLDLGADVVMTSGTKFLGGHSDVTAGMLSVRGKDVADKIAFCQNAEGAILGPHDCWLLLRGMRTMGVRMERQAYNCARLAEYLKDHPLVTKLNFAGLESHPGHDVHWRQASSGGSLLSFTTGDIVASKAIVERTQLFKITVSFGNVASQISLPCFMSHASIPAEVRAERGLPDDLVRISVGIEDADDLLRDLDGAMMQAMEQAGMTPKSHLAEVEAAGSAVLTEREKTLLDRVRHLEARLKELE
ncbi:unnamed protein product [Pedinophyceae sp. YPF-701]|nr:unnamed protein product [Pedinophyceae sp. YPF-701]